MKKFKILSAFLILLSAMNFVSCDTEPVDPVLVGNNPVDTDPGNNNNNNGPALFSVDFSGQTYTATSTVAIIEDGIISITGLKGTTGEAVSIMVPGAATGTYNTAVMSYNPGGNTGNQYTNTNGEQLTGSVIITSINTVNQTVTGSFNFTGYWTDAEANLPSIAFTNGIFQNIPYNVTTEPDPEVALYTAVIDGTFYDFTEGYNFFTSNGDMFLQGSDENDTLISLIFGEELEPGDYEILADSDVYADFSKEGEAYNVEDGMLTIISKENGWIKGTFSFTAINLLDDTISEVTEGEFNIPYE